MEKQKILTELNQLIGELRLIQSKSRYFFFALVISFGSLLMGLMEVAAHGVTEIALAWGAMQIIAVLLLHNNRTSKEELEAGQLKLDRCRELRDKLKDM